MRETKFKKTEIGLIPDTWEIVSLGQLFDFKNGLNKGKEFFGYGTPIVNFTDVFNNPKMYQSTIKGLVSVTSNDIKSCNVHKGDVFFTRTSETPEEVGMSSVLLDELESAVFSGFVLRARPKTDLLDSEYSGVCMRSNTVRQQIIKSATYTTRALTSGAKLSEVLLPLPTIAEQRKIAKALSDVDGLISSLAKLIEKKQNIKTATMQQLLTGKKRLEGFTEPWVEKELGSLCMVIKGEQLNRDKMNGDAIYPVYNGGISPSGCHSDYNTAPDTVIISEGGNSCGFVNFIHEPFWRGGHCYGLFGFEGNNDFFYQLLKFREKDIMKLRAGSGLPNIQKSNLNAFVVEIPNNFDEQIAIANILTSMDNEISALETKKAKYESIKKGMMQELLTGRIRLV